MWISDPTPVISSAKAIDRGSMSSPMSTIPGMNAHRCTAWRRCPSGSPSSSTNASTATTNEARDMATPSRWPHRSVRRPSTSRMVAPSSGMAIISQDRPITPPAVCWMISTGSTSHLLVLQQVGVVDGRGPAGSEDRHDDGEADHDLGRGHHHHEERDDLAFQVADLPGEGDEREVAGVEHELDAHEHHDRVPPGQHADGPDREQQPRQDEVMRGHSDSSSARCRMASAN